MRYNIFNQIHKALRSLLYETAGLIQQTDFTDVTESEEAFKKIQHIVDLFEKHAFHEDKYVLPAIASYDPALIQSFEQEHEEDNALGQRLKGLMNAFNDTASAADRIDAGYAIQTAYVEFMVFNLNHMAREERILNIALWKHYSDVEIVGINNNIVANIPLPELQGTSVWMMRSMNNGEIITWLKEVRSHAPEPAYRMLYQIASDELPPVRWLKVKTALEKQMAPAL